jgi:hypothetical protein
VGYSHSNPELPLINERADPTSVDRFLGDYRVEIKSPRSYRTGSYGYFATCQFPVLFATFFALSVFASRRPPAWAVGGLLISLLAVLCVVGFMKRLFLEITMEGIRYKGFRQTQFIAYSEISAVVLIDHRRGPWRPLLRWTLLVTPRVESGKSSLRIPLTFLPANACTELVHLFHPAVWDP